MYTPLITVAHKGQKITLMQSDFTRSEANGWARGCTRFILAGDTNMALFTGAMSDYITTTLDLVEAEKN